MAQAIHPLEATQRIHDDYARYLETSYYFRDEDLRQQFRLALYAPEFLVRGPLLEASPPFCSGRSISQMITAGVLHPGFRQLCSKALDLDRLLYLHQDQAIEKVISQGRNVVVATGTGSGKTEIFVISIFDQLLRQREAGLLKSPGVRALLLYPMNALVNDQLKRLRGVLKDFPDITFGRYTGETLEEQSRAEQLFREQQQAEPLPNELISREAMRKTPPHILITNYAMLEYLLLRPKDTEFFDGETGKFWRFIVLDEAHIYDGASGIEIAMLLRRLKDRVVQSERGRLRCIATSATLGKGREDFAAVARFAEEIFGEPFKWVNDDPKQQDVVESQREAMTLFGAIWGNGKSDLYAALGRAVDQNESWQAMADLAVTHGVPAETIHAFTPIVDSQDHVVTVNHFLHHVLQGDQRLRRLRDALSEPRPLDDLAKELTDDGNTDTLVNLARLAVRARSEPGAMSLLPARYHVFARALEGAFVCLNQHHPAHAEEAKPRLFLSRHETCPHCQARVFEVATCPRCGTMYVVGREVPSENGPQRSILRHPASAAEDQLTGLAYFVLTRQLQQSDEDEAALTGEEESADTEGLEPYILCLGCGNLQQQQGSKTSCQCTTNTPTVELQRVVSERDPLRRCVGCGAKNPHGVVMRFLTGQDAPVSVLATSLYQVLPPAGDEQAQASPGQGRKLLVFSDSRQDAAFFAPYLERTYGQILRRRLIMKALTEDEGGQAGRLRLQDLASRLRMQAENAGLFTDDQSFDEKTLTAQKWLMQELMALDYRNSLEGLGLIQYRLVRPKNWIPPELLMAPPWSLAADETWNLLVILLNSLRQQGAVTFPPNISPTDPVFAPRNVEFLASEYAEAKSHVLGWRPKRRGNRRLDFLIRMLSRRTDLTVDEARQAAEETLAGLWRYFTGTSLWRAHLAFEQRPQIGAVYRLDYRFWEWAPVVAGSTPIYRCSRCFNVSHINLSGVCTTYGCDGVLEEMDGLALEGNHYRRLYQSLAPIPLSAEEHTAQLTSTEAGQIQDKFVQGEVNVLSCSTTFELGVDVGELQAVLMHNVPPTTANYVQRAGRAGRRTDSVAFVLTYAQRRSHDLTHFNRPQRMVAGRVQPPVVVIGNEKIVRRHVHSVLLAAFFRWAADQYDRLFPSVGKFIDSEGEPSGYDLLRDYLKQRPRSVQEALRRIVPPELQKQLDVDGWGWLNDLVNESLSPDNNQDEQAGILDLAVKEVQGDLSLYAQLKQEAISKDDFFLAEHYKRVATTLRDRDVLGFLGTRNVLPKYGFPTDVVELRTNHVPVPEAKKIELQRDLRIAISEYAPGGEVVAAKRIWTSNGIYRMPGRDWRTFYYAVCPECGHFNRAIQSIDSCHVCGANVYSWPRRYGQFIIPEFGFLAGREVRDTSERRPQRIYASRAYFSEYAPGREDEPAIFEEVQAFTDKATQVSCRYSRYGKMAVINAGLHNSGFRVCTYCGWAEPAPFSIPGKKTKAKQTHENPRTGQQCKGFTETRHLGHEFITDVLEIRFSRTSAPPSEQNLWLSVLYALLEGVSEALGIARDDLDGTIHVDQIGQPPALVLFDNVPGGAGHVRRVVSALPDVVQTAWNRVDRCECGAETSCYECLRNYYNQYCHDQLQRGLARDFLSTLL